MGKRELVFIESIEKVCHALDCNIGDVMDIIEPDEPKSKPDFTSIELFAGSGGLALGIENAGFDTLGLVEFDHIESFIAFYNEKRPHRSIGNIPPIQAENIYWSQL